VSASAEGAQGRIVVPDISGYLWRNAGIDSEIDSEWMSELTRADSALLFVRVRSDQEVRPLDWVTSRCSGLIISDTPTGAVFCSSTMRCLDFTTTLFSRVQA
jgi:hypothetical protein